MKAHSQIPFRRPLQSYIADEIGNVDNPKFML